MTESEIVEAVLEWALEQVPDVVGSYDFIPPGKTQGLPDVAIDILTTSVVRDDPDFPNFRRQQIVVWRRDLAVSFMVEAGVTDEQARDAQLALRGFVDALLASLLADHTLGQRVPAASPLVTVDYEPAFVEYQDGTRGREVTMLLAVAEPLVPGDE